jgi:CheY-like chemotaxis protein
VDNEPTILTGLSALLERWGARAVTASDAAEALEHHGPFDAALVDLHLGEGPDGLAVIDVLRERGVSAIALITADPDETLQGLAEAAGAVLLPKPLRPAALKAFLSSRR